MGEWFALLGTVQRRMGIGVPVLIEHVVAHDETDGTIRQFEVDQHGFLMMRGGRFQEEARSPTDLRIETRASHLMGDFRSFVNIETTTDKHWPLESTTFHRLVTLDRKFGKPLAVIVVLRLGGALQGPVVDGERAFAGQVGFTRQAGSIERRLPPQYPHLDVRLRLGLE
ncbi:hypothetical protein D3C76_723000 [compost metagenome]